MIALSLHVDLTEPPREPAIVYTDDSYIAAYKPPGMHTVPLAARVDNTLLTWVARQFPETHTSAGKHPWEGLALHRLDYETCGLVLFARSADVYLAALAAQERGCFIKEYTAWCEKRQDAPPPGFPPAPDFSPYSLTSIYPFIVTSGFRPFGHGQREVRPVPLSPKLPLKTRKRAYRAANVSYKTEIIQAEPLAATADTTWRFTLRLRKGARHQIRAHLAWLGWPIKGDLLYGVPSSAPCLALAATGLDLST